MTDQSPIAPFDQVRANAFAECARSGEGLRYHHSDRFHEMMAEDSAQLIVANLTGPILPVVLADAEAI